MKGLDFEQALAALHAALDDPVERAAVDKLGRTLRDHAGGMPVLDRLAGCPALVEPHGDPFFQVLDAVAADAEL